jgi:hypothetical protein
MDAPPATAKALGLFPATTKSSRSWELALCSESRIAFHHDNFVCKLAADSRDS